MARPHFRPGDRVLDVGSAEGALAAQVPQIGTYVGIDPHATPETSSDRSTFIKGTFPDDLSTDEPFDVIALLAVLEHVPSDQKAAFAEACHAHLKPSGLLIVSVPSPLVDTILFALLAVRLIDGMSLEQHYGFRPGDTKQLFTDAGLRFVKRKRFQLGLNNLFVFSRP